MHSNKYHISYTDIKNEKKNKQKETATVILALIFFSLLMAFSAFGGNTGLTHI